MEPSEIEELEKEYFLKIRKVVGDKFDFIEDGLDFINKYKRFWEQYQKLDNAISTGIQELVRCLVFRGYTDWDPFCFPICSDTSFKTKDAIINLDVKTVKNIDKDAKMGYRQIRPNQTSYPNRPVKGIPWKPHQKPLIELDTGVRLVNLSYFVKFIWSRKDSDIELTEAVVCSVPNAMLSGHYGKDCLVNYKTYEFDMKNPVEDVESLGSVVDQWKTGVRRGWSFVKFENGSIWGKKLEKTKKYGDSWWKAINGGTARFDIKKVMTPKLTYGWKRLEYIGSQGDSQPQMTLLNPQS